MSPDGPADVPRICIVVPLHNEEGSLAVLLSEIGRALEPAGVDYRMILVDDGSRDRTWELVRRAVEDGAPVTALRLSRNFGKEQALSAGLYAAEGDAVVVMDADLQHPPSLLPEMIARWRKGDADVVEAIKTTRPDEPLGVRYGAAMFHWLMRRLSGQDLRGASDFKLLDRRVLEAYKQMDEHTVFFRGMSAWLGFRREAVPFETPRSAGRPSRWTFLRLVKLALIGVTAFSSFPLHIVSFVGGLFLVLAVVLSGQTLYMWATGQALSGFTTVILVVCFTGGALMLGLGVIGEYLARIYDEVKDRPRYVVMESISS